VNTYEKEKKEVKIGDLPVTIASYRDIKTKV